MVFQSQRLSCLWPPACALLALLLAAPSVWAQVTPVPSDLTIHFEAGSVDGDHNLYVLDLAANGRGTYCVVPPARRATGLCGSTTPVGFTAAQMSTIWWTIGNAGFFQLQPEHIADVVDGTFAELTITANGVTHTVLTRNQEHDAFDSIALAINAALPADKKVIYNAIFDQI